MKVVLTLTNENVITCQIMKFDIVGNISPCESLEYLDTVFKHKKMICIKEEHQTSPRFININMISEVDIVEEEEQKDE